MLKVTIKKFNELSLEELYSILQLRSKVFVVEQNCVYQDLDGKDQRALHIIGTKNKHVVAYARIFKSGDYFKEASIGRVVVKESQRKLDYGITILKASIAAVEQNFNETKIHVSAQKYLLNFYNSLGFEQIGEEYLEDGIPHIGMVKN